MRSVCGDSMDKFEGPNYKIMIEDCIKVLHERISNGHLHDYVINDLTEFPVEKAVRGECSVESGRILGLRPPNERRRYKVTLSLIGWTQTYRISPESDPKKYA